MNGKARDAWELYLKMDNNDSFNFLILIANDCYKVGAFYYAAKVTAIDLEFCPYFLILYSAFRLSMFWSG
jgi:hypothetical protein